MNAKDFCTSKVKTFNGRSYVLITDHSLEEPGREVAFALNSLLKNHFDELSECQEGIYESDLDALVLETKLREFGLIYNPLLDAGLMATIDSWD